MYRFRLVTRICPDGVILEGDWFRYRSNRLRSLTHELTNLENSIVCNFINAGTQEDLLGFLSRFGLFPPVVQPRQEVIGEQYMLRGMLKQAGSGDVIKRKTIVNSFAFPVGPKFDDSGSVPRLVLQTDNLSTFMRMEIAVAAVNGARLAECQYCGRAFLTGTLTARRDTSAYCKDLCRNRANRSKLKSKGGRHVGAKA